MSELAKAYLFFTAPIWMPSVFIIGYLIKTRSKT